MRAVIQRTKEASVSIEGRVTAQIGQGLLVLLGIEHEDTVEDGAWLAGKIAQMRIFSDLDGKMNHSVQEVGGGVLVVSQFTLHASTRKGNRPSFIRAARPGVAIPLYEHFMKELEAQTGRGVERGIFGADMKVALVNDGPVTFWLSVGRRG